MTAVNAMYPTGLDAILSADVDVLVDTIKVALISSSYTYSSAHDFYNDVSAYVIGTPATLGTKAVASGAFTAATTTFSSVLTGSTVAGLVVYKDTGVSSTSQLLAYICRRSDSVPISVATTGGNIVITWPSGRVFRI